MSSIKCPSCGLVNFATALFCKRCQHSFDPASSSDAGPVSEARPVPEVLPLPESSPFPEEVAPSLSSQPPADRVVPPQESRFNAVVRRDGPLLVMTEESVLPDRCVRCNAPAARQMKQKVIWIPTYIGYIALISSLIALIVSLFKRRTAIIYIGVCEKHYHRRLFGMLIGGGMIGAGLLMGFLTALNGDYWLLLYGGVSLLLGAFVVVLLTPTVSADKIEEPFIWLKGVHKDFLDALPII